MVDKQEDWWNYCKHYFMESNVAEAIEKSGIPIHYIQTFVMSDEKKEKYGFDSVGKYAIQMKMPEQNKPTQIAEGVCVVRTGTLIRLVVDNVQST